jgi:hypothetical protein
MRFREGQVVVGVPEIQPAVAAAPRPERVEQELADAGEVVAFSEVVGGREAAHLLPLLVPGAMKVIQRRAQAASPERLDAIGQSICQRRLARARAAVDADPQRPMRRQRSNRIDEIGRDLRKIHAAAGVRGGFGGPSQRRVSCFPSGP